MPSCFEAGCPGIDFYEGICWYRRTFRPDAEWKSRRVVLKFEAVNYRARVWLNDQFVGENRDGFLPFEFDIQDKLLFDGINTLAVSVDNSHHEGDVPGQHVGWRGYGGIIREVSLFVTEFLRIGNVRVVATPAGSGGEMQFCLQIENGGPRAVECAIEMAVGDPAGLVLAKLTSARVLVASGGGAEVVMDGTLTGIRAWSPSSPVLYTAHAVLKVDGRTVDETSTRFGFRRIQATPHGLLLNGEPVFLTGFNRHEDSPRTAMATDLQTTRSDLKAMKEAGANFVRLCHYPHHPAELDMCDEIGLLALDEIPLYFWNDIAEGRRTNKARVKAAARQLERMIARDFNHPSVIFWSVSNETHDDEPEVAESNRELIRLARRLDPTRLHVHVTCRFMTHPFFEEDDVMCVNYYPSIDWGGGGHTPGTFDYAGSSTKWRESLAELRGKFPDKPILVTEFGYCSFPGTYGHSFGEDEHARVLEHEFKALRAPLVCGAAIWCWADHAWPAGRFLGGLGISPFGVLGRDRRKLKPFWTARLMFRAAQGVESVGTGGGPAGGNSVFMVRNSMDLIPMIPFPDGYGIRTMTTDDIGLWTDIERDAEPYLAITDDLFRSQFGEDPGSIERRCFIVTGPRGMGVGTISAWYDRDYHGMDYGRIHWLAVRKAHQGKGLAKAALSHAMNQLAQWHERCYLQTSTNREGAIRLYLNFGFEPDLTGDDAPARWRELGSRLKHPLLAP